MDGRFCALFYSSHRTGISRVPLLLHSICTPLLFFLVATPLAATRHTTIQESRTLAYGFYTWMGVFALFNSSLFWSLVTDTFDDESGGRLFGLISAGMALRLGWVQRKTCSRAHQ